MTKYFDLYGDGLDPMHGDPNWFAKIKGDWLCPICRKPQIEGPIDVYLGEKPPPAVLNIVFGLGGTGIARADFLLAFGERVAEQYLHLGRVFGPIDSETPNFVSFRGRTTALIRGDEESTYRGRCEACNELLYFPMGERYLLTRPQGFADMMVSQFGCLIVSESLLRTIRADEWDELAIDELPIFEEPRDGLPKDPADWPPPRITPSEERYRRIQESERRAKRRLESERSS